MTSPDFVSLHPGYLPQQSHHKPQPLLLRASDYQLRYLKWNYATAEKIMGSSSLEKVRAEALNLSESERAELAHNLVASLDGPADSDVEKAWDAEILRRLSEIDSGTANLINREEFRRKMRSRLGRT